MAALTKSARRLVSTIGIQKPGSIIPAALMYPMTFKRKEFREFPSSAMSTGWMGPTRSEDRKKGTKDI